MPPDALPARRSRAGDRADLRAPRSSAALSEHPELANWRVGAPQPIASGFYISQAMEVERHEPRHRHCRSGILMLGPQCLPFADAATAELPLGRLLRLSLFQVTVGMAAVLLIGTLNRVMIVELGVPSWIVACMLALPLLSAPLRTLIGFRSDHHRSVLGWRRVPFIWFGTMAQFGGFAIMPFALLILSGDTTGPLWTGTSPPRSRSFWSAPACTPFRPSASRSRPISRRSARGRGRRAAVRDAARRHGRQRARLWPAAATFQRGPADPGRAGRRGRHDGAQLGRALEAGAAHFDHGRAGAGAGDFRDAWNAFATTARTRRRLVATALGTAGFTMQDILLEPYGGKILHLPVGATTALTAMLAIGGGVGLGWPRAASTAARTRIASRASAR